jgi:hypothetical protein
MFKKIDDIPIDPEDPFKNDILKRKPYAEALTNLIKTISQPMVLSVNGPWGTGKTTFLRMWEAKLKNDGFPCVFFNAWESDFSEEPFISFVLEIEEAIAELSLGPEPKKNTAKIINSLKSGAAKILKYGLPLAVRIGSQGLINIDAETDKAIDKTLEKVAKDKLAQYGKMKDSISAFKENLIALSTQLQKEEGSKPIIFFVDELDRCRPSYAIKLLENIKHLFDTKGYIFILGVDREQLGHTVHSIYGQGMDADGYLKRFIDVEYPLPKPATEDYVGSLIKNFNLHGDIFSKRNEGDYQVRDLREAFIALAEIFQLSLRVQNQCMAQLNFIFRVIPKDHHFHASLLTFLVILKNVDSESYNSVRMSGKYEDLIPKIESNPSAEEFRTTKQWVNMKTGLIYSQNFSRNGRRKIEALIDKFAKKSNAVNNSEEDKEEYYDLAELLRHHMEAYGYSVCKYLIGYIDLAELNPR